MKYVHLRYHRNQDINKQNTEGISNLGGATIAYDKRDDSKEVWWAFSVCREDENFCRKQGREYALNKFNEDEFYIYKYDTEFDPNLFLSTVAIRKVYNTISRSHYWPRVLDMIGIAYHNINYFLY